MANMQGAVAGETGDCLRAVGSFEFAVDLLDNGQHGEAILSRRYTRVAHGSVV